nr:formin-like protein 5 [Ipomoea batatas]
MEYWLGNSCNIRACSPIRYQPDFLIRIDSKDEGYEDECNNESKGLGFHRYHITADVKAASLQNKSNPAVQSVKRHANDEEAVVWLRFTGVWPSRLDSLRLQIRRLSSL